MRKRKTPGQIVLLLMLGIYAMVCLLPLLLIVVVSFTDNNCIKKYGFSFFPKKFSLAAYQYVADFGGQIVQSYCVTIFITVAGTLFSLAVMSMFAYALSRRYFELRKHLAIILLIPMLFSGGQLAEYLLNCTVYNLKDTLAVLILPGISTMYVIMMRTFIQENVPDSLIESAKIDGAGDFFTFIKIVIPVMLPIIAAVGFMLAVNYWNDWIKGFMYIESIAKTPLQLMLVKIEKNVDFLMSNTVLTAELQHLRNNLPQENGRMAILLVAIGPIILAYPFFQKYFVKGITIGAVKG